MTAQDKALKENTASAPLQIVAPGTCVETGEQATLVLGMYDHLVETIHQYNPSADFAQIDKAFRYADTHHNGQLRKDGSPFITHPLAVAQIIAEELRMYRDSLDDAARAAFDQAFNDASFTDGDAERIADSIRAAGFDQATRMAAEGYLGKARAALASLPSGPEQDILQQMADYVRDRKK